MIQCKSFGALWISSKKFLYMELSVSGKFPHNNDRWAIILNKSVNRYISKLLGKYQEPTQKACAEMAIDPDITISNLYLSRTGKGNPWAKQ